MGSLHKGSKGIDESLGGLVWVWRRNGRWWPGRILDPQELPACLPESNSGTIVKLLGKEDVDWYTVDKPTHVKAFRCGEYDECIEKAEVIAAKSSKRMVKPPKRPTKEDAIMLALEIERACLGKDHPVSNPKMTDPWHEFEDLPRSFCQHEDETNNVCENLINSEIKSDSALGLSLSTVSSEDPAYTDAYEDQTVESNDSEDDGAQVVKHMKELDNLGAPVIASSKRQRFEVAHVHEFLKRKHRQRTVTKILESNVMVTIPVVYEKLAHPTKSLPRGASVWEVSGLRSHVLNTIFSLKDNSDDGLYDVPVVTEEQHCADLVPLVSNTSEGVGVCGGRNREVKSVSLCESGSISSGTADMNDIDISKWQRKGKRSRYTNKNRRKKQAFSYACDECSVDDDNHTHPLKSRAVAEMKIDEERWGNKNKNTSQIVPYDELHTRQRHLPHRESRCSINSKYQGFLMTHHTVQSPLFDVNIEVNSNYRPQHVPYVSLTSKINGPSIIGHLLTVEILKDGFSHNELAEMDDELAETTTALGRSNPVCRISVKHALQQNGTPSKSRKCGLLYKKIRKLSSLTGAREERGEKKLGVKKPRAPSVAFVPLTIVFSRLNEALSCPK